VRYQVNEGFVLGQVLVPAGTVINLTKADAELTEFERLAKGRPIPIDATALDADAAVAILRSCPDHHRHRLRRDLSPFDQETFQRLLGMSEEALQERWPRGG
jgi:hypothetical protein